MSYAKSLKKSPFKTLSLSLGKMPDGSIWQAAFITQDGDAPSAFFDCPSNATAAERKGFLPLVKEALKRAQSLDELTDMLKPAPVEKPGHKTLKDYEQWTAEQRREALAHESTLRGKLIFLLQVGKNETASIEAVLNSGLLPEALLRQWLNQLVERAIRSCQGRRDCPEWEQWAKWWLSDGNKSDAKWCRRVADAAARSAMWDLSWAAGAAESTIGRPDPHSVLWYINRIAAPLHEAAERKAQYDDLFNLINTL